MMKFEVVETGNVSNRYDLWFVRPGGLRWICRANMTRHEAQLEVVKQIKDDCIVRLFLLGGTDGPVRSIVLGENPHLCFYECRGDYTPLWQAKDDVRAVRWHNTVIMMLDRPDNILDIVPL